MNRPNFGAAWAAAIQIYSPINSGAKVAQMIGGSVAKNINNPNPKQAWNNTCAVRMSYILGHAGLMIPAIPRKTVTGGDGKQYFFRIADVIEFLTEHWGAPDLILPFPISGDVLHGKKGIIMFEVTGWTDAKGHATLWSGTVCYDHCFFDVPAAPRIHTPRANFWRLS